MEIKSRVLEWSLARKQVLCAPLCSGRRLETLKLGWRDDFLRRRLGAVIIISAVNKDAAFMACSNHEETGAPTSCVNNKFIWLTRSAITRIAPGPNSWENVSV
jgi:hypothetical protein